MSDYRYERVLLKLSGEALMGDGGYGIDPSVTERLARQIKELHDDGVEVGIVAAGSGNPYFTTDTAAALRACEIGADCLLKATKVDGIYDMDPVANDDATRFESISYHEVLVRGLQVMDSTATALCQDNHMPIIVLNIDGDDNIKKALTGEPVGTVVYQED